MKEYTTDQLISRKKLLKTIQYVVIAVILIYAAAMIFFLTREGAWQANNTMQSMPFVLMMISIIITSASIKKIDEELEKR